MRRTRRRLSAALLVLLAAVAFACEGPAELGGAGDECFRADDCGSGLVCVEGACSADLSGVVATDPGPVYGGAGAPAGAAGAASGGAAGTVSPGSGGVAGAAGTSGAGAVPGSGGSAGTSGSGGTSGVAGAAGG